ncbi:MAG: hypothetical protein OXC13_18720 [Caldilineaceae bacterium]|nr:hypothetical protein [Caldilineaceae bacterium]
MLLGAVQSLSGRLAAHALNAMGKTPRDVGHSNWLGDGPLAGWGSLPLDYFSPPTVAERERTAEAVAAIRLFLGNVLSPAVLDRIESAWHRNEPSEDHLQAIHAVLQTPSAWRTLLPDDHKDVPATGQSPIRDEPRPPPGPA